MEPIRAWLAADRPFLGICLGLQLLFEASDEDGAETLGVLPGRTARLEDAPTLPHIGWNQVVGGEPAPAVRRHRPRRRLLLRPLVRRRAGGRRGAEAVLAETAHGATFVSAVARGRAPGRPVPPGAARRRRPPPVANVVAPARGCLMLRRRVIPCLDVANGRVVKGTRFVDLIDEGDPPELAERYAHEGADELVFLDITAAPEGAAPCSTSWSGRRGARSSRSPSAAAFGPWRRCGTCCGPAPTRSSLNTAAVADPALIDAVRAPVRAPGGRRRHRCAAAARRRPVHRRLRSWSGAAATRPACDAVAWAVRAVALGAGELLVTSIDRDGTESGFDTELLRAITSRSGFR